MPKWILDKKTIYHVHIPKTAGSILKFSAQKLGAKIEHFSSGSKLSKATPQHEDFKTLSKKFKLNKNNCFTVIREPWQRTLSAYVWNTGDKDFKNINIWLKNNLKKVLNDKVLMDNHFLPQKYFVSDKINVFCFNKLKNLEKWLQDNFTKKFNIISNDLEGKVRKYKKNIDKINLLDKETLKLWHELYDEDVALWSQQERKTYVS